MTKKSAAKTGKAGEALAKPATKASSAEAGIKAPSEKVVKSSSMPLPKSAEAAAKAPDIKSVETKPGELKTPASTASAPAATPVPQAGGRSATFGAIVTIIILGMAGTGAWISRDQWWAYVAPLLPGAENWQSADMMARVAAVEDHIARQAAEQDEDQSKGTESVVFAELQRERDRLTAELSAVMTRLEAVEQSLARVERLAGAVTADGSLVAAGESLRELADRLSTLEAGGNVDDGSGRRLSDVLERLRTVEDRTRAMKSAAAEDTAALAGVQSRIDAIESRPAPVPAALVLGVGQLRDAVRHGSSYENALEALSATMAASGDVAGAHTYLQTLRDHAVSGAPNLLQLQRSFGDVADATFDAGEPPGDGGWLSWTLHQLRRIVRIRNKDASAKPGSVESRIARAEDNLSMGDLAAAIQVLSGLDGAAATAMASWLLSAESRLAVDDALTQLHTFAINRMMSGSAVPGSAGVGPTVAGQE